MKPNFMLRHITALFIGACLCLPVLPARAQIALAPRQFQIYDSHGSPATLPEIVERCQRADVVFWGEEHDDAVGHALQARFFQQLIARYKTSRQVALSLEMFERDTQVVLDEYLAGQITEQHFLRDARPWNNYAQDYKPLLLLAKENRLEVVAANAPRRYVNLVARRGRTALTQLSPLAKSWLAPLPYPAASAAYARKFKALMGDEGRGSAMGRHGTDILDSQALWDATMADSLSRWLKKSKRPLVLHLSGRFHSEGRLGTVEQLFEVNPHARVCVVSVVSSSTSTFDPKTQAGLGDFVILTPAHKPSS